MQGRYRLGEDLEGKVVVVSGGARGIGRVTAEMFASHGARVVITDVLRNQGQKVAENIRSTGAEAEFYELDITDAVTVERVYKQIEDRFGAIDVLVNNAAIWRGAEVLKVGLEDWDAVFEVNVKGTLNCSQAAGRIMRRQHSGSIVNVSSIDALFANRGNAAYAASKAAIIQMTRSFGLELAKYNINVNCVVPGTIERESHLVLEPAEREAVCKVVPMRRIGKMEEVASVIVFLASQAASFMTGQTVIVDGGRMINGELKDFDYPLLK